MPSNLLGSKQNLLCHAWREGGKEGRRYLEESLQVSGTFFKLNEPWKVLPTTAWHVFVSRLLACSFCLRIRKVQCALEVVDVT
jgi:hypothetical protein